MYSMLFVVLSLLTPPASAQGPFLGAVHRFHTIAENVIVAEPRYSGGNSTIIVRDDHVVVVDAQGSQAAARVLIDEIRRFTTKPVQWVVNTHWHGDHHGGNAAFLEAFPDARVVAHPGTVEGIEGPARQEIHGVAPFLRRTLEGAERDLASGTQEGRALSEAQVAQLSTYLTEEIAFLEAVPEDYAYARPNRVVEEDMALEGGGLRVEVRVAGPAHTEGDLYVLLPDLGIGGLGDLLTVPYVVPRSGFPASYASTLRELAELDLELVVPGHGQTGSHEGLMLTMADFLEQVWSIVEATLSAGGATDEAVEAALSDSRVRRFDARIDWDAPGGLTFLDFDRLVQMTVARAAAELRGG